MKDGLSRERERRSPDRLVSGSQSGDWRSHGKEGARGWYSRGYLPHFDAKSVIQHVTVHLADSLPRSAIDKIDRALVDVPDDDRKTQRRKRLHEWIDAGHGACVLRHPAIADMVQDTFLHFKNVRYRLHAWVVMPNHIHVLFEPIDDWPLAKIVASWKKFTARRIRDWLAGNGGVLGEANREIGVPRRRAAPVWHREYWDRYIRNERHYMQAIDYIHQNPVTANLAASPAAWRWSSAAHPGNADLPIGSLPENKPPQLPPDTLMNEADRTLSEACP